MTKVLLAALVELGGVIPADGGVVKACDPENKDADGSCGCTIVGTVCTDTARAGTGLPVRRKRLVLGL